MVSKGKSVIKDVEERNLLRIRFRRLKKVQVCLENFSSWKSGLSSDEMSVYSLKKSLFGSFTYQVNKAIGSYRRQYRSLCSRVLFK
jgi:hypothetical protein